MAQFTAYRNLDAGSRTGTPYLLDVQSNLLDDLATRAVIPLRLASSYSGRPLATLTPRFAIEGQDVLALAQQLAAIPKKHLGAPVADLSERRAEIMAALDFLISGF